jgi:hypothetical protein
MRDGLADHINAIAVFIDRINPNDLLIAKVSLCDTVGDFSSLRTSNADIDNVSCLTLAIVAHYGQIFRLGTEVCRSICAKSIITVVLPPIGSHRSTDSGEIIHVRRIRETAG